MSALIAQTQRPRPPGKTRQPRLRMKLPRGIALAIPLPPKLKLGCRRPHWSRPSQHLRGVGDSTVVSHHVVLPGCHSAVVQCPCLGQLLLRVCSCQIRLGEPRVLQGKSDRRVPTRRTACWVRASWHLQNVTTTVSAGPYQGRYSRCCLRSAVLDSSAPVHRLGTLPDTVPKSADSCESLCEIQD